MHLLWDLWVSSHRLKSNMFESIGDFWALDSLVDAGYKTGKRMDDWVDGNLT